MQRAFVVFVLVSGCRFNFEERSTVDAGPRLDDDAASGEILRTCEPGSVCTVDCRDAESCLVDCAGASLCQVACSAAQCVVLNCVDQLCAVDCGEAITLREGTTATCGA